MPPGAGLVQEEEPAVLSSGLEIRSLASSSIGPLGSLSTGVADQWGVEPVACGMPTWEALDAGTL